MAAVSSRFAAILSQIGWPSRHPKNPIDLVGFTSCLPKQGVSTIASQVAISAAVELGIRTLLVDCHVVRPVLHRTLGVSQCPGFFDVVSGECDIEQAIYQTAIENLELIPCGNLNLYLSSSEELIRGLLRHLVSEYQLVICDLPPIGTQSNALPMLAVMDKVLIVVDSDNINTNQLEKSSRLLEQHGIVASGLVINQIAKPGYK